MNPSRRCLGLALAVALAVGACGGGDSAEDAGNGEPTASERVPGPLEELLGFGGTPAEQQERYAAEERERQEYIVTCMAEQGFEYRPVDYGIQVLGPAGDLTEEEFVAQYGYGIATMFEEQFPEPEQEYQDPNAEIVDAMSEAERDAYYEALYGVAPAYDPTIEGDDPTVGFDEPGGCQGEALTEIGTSFAVFEEFGEELSDLFSRMESDPRIQQATGGWAACMAEKGYEYDSPDDVYEDLFDDMNVVNDAVYGSFEELAEAVVPDGSVVEDGGETTAAPFPTGAPTLDAETQAELDRIIEKELAVAQADFECQREYRDLVFEVSRELEQQFVDENRERLDELLAG